LSEKSDLGPSLTHELLLEFEHQIILGIFIVNSIFVDLLKFSPRGNEKLICFSFLNLVYYFFSKIILSLILDIERNMKDMNFIDIEIKKCVTYLQEDFLFEIHHRASRRIKTSQNQNYHSNEC
jgi:hypothetical protein